MHRFSFFLNVLPTVVVVDLDLDLDLLDLLLA